MGWKFGDNIRKRRAARDEEAETAANTDEFGIDQRMYNNFTERPGDMGSILNWFYGNAEVGEDGQIDMEKMKMKAQDHTKRKGLLQILQDMMSSTTLEEPYKYDSMGSNAQERHLLKARNKYPKGKYTNPWLASTASKQQY